MDQQHSKPHVQPSAPIAPEVSGPVSTQQEAAPAPRQCPDCGAPLAYQGRCGYCPCCGFSLCG